MIFGVGVDITEVARVKRAIKNSSSFQKKVFSSREIAKCTESNIGSQCFAARFAGKEAFMKAVGTGWAEGLKWTEIEILNDDKGKPILHLSGESQKMIETLKVIRMSVSLTHVKEYAMAVVILEVPEITSS